MIGKHLDSTLYIHVFISAFNCICLMGCSPQEMPRCWHVGGLGKLSSVALQTENLTSLFYGDFFCFLLQSCRFCDATNTQLPVQNTNGHHWYAATTGRQPVGFSNSINDCVFRQLALEMGSDQETLDREQIFIKTFQYSITYKFQEMKIYESEQFYLQAAGQVSSKTPSEASQVVNIYS